MNVRTLILGTVLFCSITHAEEQPPTVVITVFSVRHCATCTQLKASLSDWIVTNPGVQLSIVEVVPRQSREMQGNPFDKILNAAEQRHDRVCGKNIGYPVVTVERDGRIFWKDPCDQYEIGASARFKQITHQALRALRPRKKPAPSRHH